MTPIPPYERRASEASQDGRTPSEARRAKVVDSMGYMCLCICTSYRCLYTMYVFINNHRRNKNEVKNKYVEQ
jgi:hypothetical protein